MNEDLIADLKQFIVAVTAQQTAELRTDIARVDKKVDDLSAFVAEAINVSNEENASHLNDHEQRIVRLERKAA